MAVARGSQPAAREVEGMVMRYVLLAGLIVFAACTKPNPDFCCTDEADCAAVGESEPLPCGDGLSCRGNQCVAERCESAAECDATSPFCATDSGLCESTCAEDAQCPGFGGAAAPYCVSGACVECRSGAECTAAAPICDDNACRGCTANAECASGACGAGGACVDESAISYVSPQGTAAAPCTRESPCSLAHALDGTLTRELVILASGTYTSATGFVVTGTRRLLGDPAAPPTLTRSTAGPIIIVQLASNLTVEHLEVTGATGASTATPRGVGIQCGDFGESGSRTLTVVDSTFHHNESDGVQGSGCTVTAVRSHFDHNQHGGLALGDSTANVDGCTFFRNLGNGANLDGGVLHVTNSIAAHNRDAGFAIYASIGNSTFDFNTLADNATGVTASATGTSTLTARNNLTARNTSNLFCDPCTVAGNVAVGTDISGVKFQSPDSEPYDYHLLAGSSAIDAAVATTPAIDHDIDGEARPNGTAADVGADEYVP